MITNLTLCTICYRLKQYTVDVSEDRLMHLSDNKLIDKKLG